MIFASASACRARRSLRTVSGILSYASGSVLPTLVRTLNILTSVSANASACPSSVLLTTSSTPRPARASAAKPRCALKLSTGTTDSVSACADPLSADRLNTGTLAAALATAPYNNAKPLSTLTMKDAVVSANQWTATSLESETSSFRLRSGSTTLTALASAATQQNLPTKTTKLGSLIPTSARGYATRSNAPKASTLTRFFASALAWTRLARPVTSGVQSDVTATASTNP